jgi:hypothetical protein
MDNTSFKHGDNGVAFELLKAGWKPIFEELKRLFNSVITSGTSPKV